MSNEELRKPSLLSRAVQRVIIWIYRWMGWRIEGALPRDLEKYVIVGAPHTSNWDFVFFAGATHHEKVRPSFMGKHTLFTGCLRQFMFDMGGIPIDRTRRTNAVEQVACEFARRDKLALVIAVEGSRGSDGQWKSGFYNIAQAAGVPIVPAYADNANRIVGFGEPLVPCGDYGKDLARLAAWFRAMLPDCERFKVLEAQARAIREGPGAQPRAD